MFHYSFFLIIIFPHIFWLVENNFLTIQYGLSRSSAGQEVLINHLINPIVFISKQFLILTPIFILCFCLIKKIKLKIIPKDKKISIFSCYKFNSTHSIIVNFNHFRSKNQNYVDDTVLFIFTTISNLYLSKKY